MNNKIVLEAKCNFQDTELRDAYSSIQEKLRTLNERTKSHTIEIRKLKKRIKSLEVKK